MTILDKHPGPWTVVLHDDVGDGAEVKEDADAIRDANGSSVFWSADLGGKIEFDDDQTERLILAAPELLAALKECVRFVPFTAQATTGPLAEARQAHETARALIDRIEKGEE